MMNSRVKMEFIHPDSGIVMQIISAANVAIVPAENRMISITNSGVDTEYVITHIVHNYYPGMPIEQVIQIYVENYTNARK